MLRLEDAGALIDEVTEIAYDKAVELVIDAVRAEAQHGAVAGITLTEEFLVAAAKIPSVTFFETRLSYH